MRNEIPILCIDLYSFLENASDTFSSKLYNTMRNFFIYILKIFKYFALIFLVVMTLGLWKLFTTKIPYFELGTADNRPATVRIRGGNDKIYEADIPTNYLHVFKRYLLTITAGVNGELSLWANYPTFEGYFPADPTKPRTGRWIYFNLTKADDFSESQLQARYGQKGVQALFDEYWQLSHTLSKQQPYGNPVEYVVKWKSEQKDYIYDAGDHAVRIECGRVYQKSCSAYKLWRNTKIVIEYIFPIDLLHDFGHIESGIDKLLDSFNFREKPNYYSQAEMAKQKKWPSYYNSCFPHHYATMLEYVDSIVESGEGIAWQNDDFVTALVRQYIRVGCDLEKVTSRLKSVNFNVEKQKPQQSAEVILKIPLRQNKRFVWLRPLLEIRIAQQQGRVESVAARIYHPDFFNF
jgi:hypothetical protein